ncbi:MAG: 2-hydroxyacid dehydrogenase [Armatimonadota bacterium]
MDSYTIFVTRRISDAARRKLEALGAIIYWDEEHPVPHGELIKGIRRADALLCTGDDQIDRKVLAAGRRLRVVSTTTAGVDHIDLDAARELGITVSHTPGVADAAVADLTLSLLLACARHLIDADYFVKHREWKYWSPELLLGIDLHGSAIGIIGLGYIGLQVAHRAAGFGMRVLYYNTTRDEDAEQSLGVQYGSLDNVLREADFVTLHVPLTSQTRGMIDERRLRLMKSTAYLINMARGPVVDHDALVRALREGWIAGAGLDVYDIEPIPADDPLLELPNVILTPHIGANTREALDRAFMMAAEQIVQSLHGQRPAHAVVFPQEQLRRAA